MIVAVVGKGRNCPARVVEVAQWCGTEVAAAGHTVLTGGLGGVMKAAVAGAQLVGGETITLLPAGRELEACEAGIVLRTGMTEPVRNVIIGSACDAMLALAGSHGTMQEIAVAIDREIPVAAVDCDAWAYVPGVLQLRLEEVIEWLRRLGS